MTPEQKAYKKAWRAKPENRAKGAAYAKEYRKSDEHKEAHRKRSNITYHKNKDSANFKALRKAQHARSYDSRKSYIKARMDSLPPEVKMARKAYLKKYAKENAEKAREAKRRWKRENPERVNASERKHRKLRKLRDPAYIVKVRLRDRMRRAVKNASTRKHSGTMELLGCTGAECVDYLVTNFTDGMTLLGLMTGKIEIDHVIPVSSFNLLDPEEQKRCFHYTNLQPLWKHDNRRKSDTLPNNIIKGRVVTEVTMNSNFCVTKGTDD